MAFDGPPGTQEVTTAGEFGDTLGAAVRSAVENSVDVRGSWLVDDVAGWGYDVEIVAVAPHNGSVAAAVVKTVAECEAVAPTDLPPLAGAVDPVELEAVTAADDDRHRLSFEYHGYAVTVHADGSVSVEE